MESKQALQELRRMNPQTTIQNTMLIERYLDLCKEVVEKDLELFEKCKNENCDYQIENAKLKDKLEELQEENKKQLERIKMLEKDIITTYEFNKELREENSKLKKFINSLSNKSDFIIMNQNKEVKR